MTVVIWGGTLFLITLLNLILGYITGFKAGYLVVYFLWFFLAKKLCVMWKEHVIIKNATKNNVSAFDFIRKEIPREVVDGCESRKSDTDCMKTFLKQCVKSQLIEKEYVNIITKEFSHGGVVPFSTETNQQPDIASDAIAITPNVKETKDINEQSTDSNHYAFCRICGAPLIENSRFCSKCGTQVIKCD